MHNSARPGFVYCLPCHFSPSYKRLMPIFIQLLVFFPLSLSLSIPFPYWRRGSWNELLRTATDQQMGPKVIAPWIGYKYEEVSPFRLAQSHISFCIRFLLLLLVCVPLFGCCGVKIVESVFLTHKFPCGSYGQTQWWSCNKERMLREMNMDDILHLFDSFECRRTMDLYLVKKTILAVSGSMNTTDRNMPVENIQSTSGPRTSDTRYFSIDILCQNTNSMVSLFASEMTHTPRHIDEVIHAKMHSYTIYFFPLLHQNRYLTGN